MATGPFAQNYTCQISGVSARPIDGVMAGAVVDKHSAVWAGAVYFMRDLFAANF